MPKAEFTGGIKTLVLGAQACGGDGTGGHKWTWGLFCILYVCSNQAQRGGCQIFPMPLVVTWILPFSCSVCPLRGSTLLSHLPHFDLISGLWGCPQSSKGFHFRPQILVYASAPWPWPTVLWLDPSTQGPLSQDPRLPGRSTPLSLSHRVQASLDSSTPPGTVCSPQASQGFQLGFGTLSISPFSLPFLFEGLRTPKVVLGKRKVLIVLTQIWFACEFSLKAFRSSWAVILPKVDRPQLVSEALSNAFDFSGSNSTKTERLTVLPEHIYMHGHSHGDMQLATVN